MTSEQAPTGGDNYRTAIEKAAIIRRFDEAWEEQQRAKGDSPRPADPVLDVLVHTKLTAAMATFLAERHGSDSIYMFGEIKGGRLVLAKEYASLALKGTARREHSTAWKRWFKEQTGQVKAKKKRAARKGGAN